ncbi:DUF3363 domain-containing protein [Brevundimonas sp. NPDC092305]|uniref:DUF3363 domain-containing protein n=1 Tax=Brevundimonas sp. NPDC092305 TaxID=3363957 RepID=UPI0038214116
MAHIRYVERDGAGPAGEPVELFGPQQDQADGHAFAYTAQDDRHHFRLTIAPEDGVELGDLRAFGRELMSRVERDLGTRLEWVAGAHHDTGRPHLHLVIRGVRDDGRTLRIERDYMTSGFRDRAQEIATEALGSRPLRSQPHILRLDRFTPLDRWLVENAIDGKVTMKDLPDLIRSDALQRLGHLETRGWVKREDFGTWSIPTSLRRDLSGAQERSALESAATRVLADSALKAPVADLVDATPRARERLVGSYVGTRFVGPYAGGVHVLVLDLHDGRLGYIRMPDQHSVLCLDRIPEGSIIQVGGWPRDTRAADRTVADVAARNGGVWSPSRHSAAFPADTPKFIERHLKRVSSLAREGACEWLDGDRFAIPEDFAQRGLKSDSARWGDANPVVHVLDDRPLSQQVDAKGQTWLDRELSLDQRFAYEGRFGRDVHVALEARVDHLRREGLGSGDSFRLSSDDLVELGLRTGQEMFDACRERGKAFFMAQTGDRVRGVYTQKIHPFGGAFAVIETDASATLVPWKPGLEACRGQQITGVLGENGLEFRTARALSRGLGLEL